MTNKLKSAEDIRRLARMFENMGEAADALEQIGSLEQAAMEAQDAVTAARAVLEKAQEETAFAKQELSDVRAESATVIADARQKADEITNTAQRAATLLQEDTRAAIAHAKSVTLRTIEADREAALLELRGVTEQLEEKQKAINDMDAALGVKTEELDALQGSIESLRARLGAAAGAL